MLSLLRHANVLTHLAHLAEERGEHYRAAVYRAEAARVMAEMMGRGA